MSRRQIKTSVRFEVFKRDNFTCQYCGRKAPDIVLQCDHIVPVAAGGDNDVMNLVTSCFECNNGKSDRSLSETHIINRQRAEMELLNERRGQLEMLMQWRQELSSFKDEETSRVLGEICRVFGIEFGLTDDGLFALRSWINRFGIELVLDAAEGAAKSYIEKDATGAVTELSLSRAITMIPRVASVLKREKTDPGAARLFYIRGILRRRLSYMNERSAMTMMEDARSAGVPVEEIEYLAKTCRNWSQFRAALLNQTGDDENG